MPCIKHGERLIGQSQACATFAASLGLWTSGILGGPADYTANLATEVMMVATNEDLRVLMYKALFGPDDAKAAALADMPKSVAPKLESIERALARKTTPGPFFFSQLGPSLADLALYDNVESPFPGLKKLGVDLSAYPLILKCVAAVGEAPLVKSHTTGGAAHV